MLYLCYTYAPAMLPHTRGADWGYRGDVPPCVNLIAALDVCAALLVGCCVYCLRCAILPRFDRLKKLSFLMLATSMVAGFLFYLI